MAALRSVQQYADDSGRGAAFRRVSADTTIPLSRLYAWDAQTRGQSKTVWPTTLAPQHRPGGHNRADIPKKAWQQFLRRYLHIRKPTLSQCYREVQKAYPGIPSEMAFRRRLKEIDPKEIILAREGAVALSQKMPSMIRTVGHLHAMQHVNGDGYQSEVRVFWPGEAPRRATIWWWQDVHSRMIVGWWIGRSESSDVVRMAFAEMVERYGVPLQATIDNTPAASNKWLSGRSLTRRRFRVQPEDPVGIFERLGVDVTWTSIREGKGWGQGKPVERANLEFRSTLDKDAQLIDHWSKETALPVEAFRQAVVLIVREHNERTGRQTEMAEGVKSFGAVFRESYAISVIAKATKAQQRSLLLAAEPVTVDTKGCVALQVGRGRVGRNVYHHKDLYRFDRQKVVVRFNPRDLWTGVEVEDLAGNHICTARIWLKGAFDDKMLGREQNRLYKEEMKATKKALGARTQRKKLEEAPTPTTPQELPPLPAPGAFGMVVERH